MTDIWTPEGNKKQIEIDVELAALDNHRSRAAIDLAYARKNLIMIEEDLKDLTECLDQLKGDVRIVSIAEFHLIRQSKLDLIRVRQRHLDALTKIKDLMTTIDKQKEELLELRQRSATKILEFDLERTKERSKDRN